MNLTYKSFCVTLLSIIMGTFNISAQMNVNDILNDLKKQLAPDSRTAVWEINAVNEGNTWLIKGKVDNNITKSQIINTLSSKNIAFTDSIKVMEYSYKKPWGIVMLSIASLRTSGKHASEMATQAIMGTPVKILEKAGDWFRVQTPDNYIAYIPANSMAQISQLDFDKWRKSKRYIVTTYQSQLVEAPNSEETVSDLVLGNILEYLDTEGEYVKLKTPDGREGFAKTSDVKEFSEWANQTFDAKLIEKTAKRMMGSGYLWGGTSTKITDCSGLAKVSYFSNGIILQRDASQQALTGKKISADNWKEAELGDLLFFGNKNGRVTHVALYLHDGLYIHCSGRVKINSVDPNDQSYLTTPFLSISRINGMVGTKGITSVKDHIWYF